MEPIDAFARRGDSARLNQPESKLFEPEGRVFAEGYGEAKHEASAATAPMGSKGNSCTPEL